MSRRRRKCHHCSQLYEADPRNRRHQKHCSQHACRAASKAASQKRWLASPKGCDYFTGSANIQRVRAWRAAHPGYARGRSKRVSALQDLSPPQTQARTTPAPELSAPALQDVSVTQRLLIIGLIAQLTGSALQEDIASTTRRLVLLGRQIDEGSAASGAPRDAQKTLDLPAALAPCAGAVQLDRSTPGSG